jgi:hypothetical protein
MNLSQVVDLFARAGCNRLFAKLLAENDNSKNQIYFAGAVEALNAFPSVTIYAENSKSKGPTFKARLDFSWLLPDGRTSPAPHAQLILYSQYPEVRFSGFLLGCENAPTKLMLDRQSAKALSAKDREMLAGRVLFMGITSDRRILGYAAAGNSEAAHEFRSSTFPAAFVVFSQIPLPSVASDEDSQKILLRELARIHDSGWIDSKQLDSSGQVLPCKAPQCGGFTLEAELKISKNSAAEPDFMGWEIKQHKVSNLTRPDSGGAITLMTPEPTVGIYKVDGAEAFIRKYGYADRHGRVDRMNFGGVHRVGSMHPTTKLTMIVDGYDLLKRQITNAEGAVKLVDSLGNVAAGWPLAGLLSHWSHKHAKAAYVPSVSRKTPSWQYRYGGIVRMAQGTNALRFLDAFVSGHIFYDPGIKLEDASTKPKVKKRSQFRVTSKDIAMLYTKLEKRDLSEPGFPVV